MKVKLLLRCFDNTYYPLIEDGVRGNSSKLQKYEAKRSSNYIINILMMGNDIRYVFYIIYVVGS